MTNKTKFNLSFAGCGFLGIYHVGVAACLKKYAPHLIVSKASGASAGAIAAVCLLCDAPLGQITKDVLRIATLARSKALGPFSPSFNICKILRDGLEKILPEDAHIRVSGKVHISLTRVYDRQNVIVSQFDSREELIEVVICSTFIPFFSGFMPPKYRGYRHVDGGFTNNNPILDEHTITVNPFCGESDICPSDGTSQLFHAILCSGFIPVFSGWVPPKFQGVRYIDGCYSINLPIIDDYTITVSPFAGESDICPRDGTAQLIHVNLSNTSIELSRQNLYRFSRTLFPPKAEILSKMCQQGFDDALRFLARNDLIGCTRCMSSDTTMSLGEELDEMASKNYERIISEESCHQCKEQKQAALLDGLPDTVVHILQDAIESGNKGLLNWLFSHQSVRILSLMTLPWVIPADMAYATTLKLFETAPKLTYNLKVLSEAVIQLVAEALNKWAISPSNYSAKLTCQLAITEYDDIEAPVESEKTLQRRASVRNKMNFGFTLNIDNRDNLQQPFVSESSNRKSSHIEFDDGDEDTFDRVLKVTSHQEALLAYYYMNSNTSTTTDSCEIYNEMDSRGLPPSRIYEVV